MEERDLARDRTGRRETAMTSGQTNRLRDFAMRARVAAVVIAVLLLILLLFAPSAGTAAFA